MLAAMSCGALQAAALRNAPKRPNFIFVLLDDMGWRDLGCFGSTFYQTPCIDRLAAEGMRFTNAYAAAPLCSPTRASIMTGKYPARLGMTHIIQFRPNRKEKWLQPETARELPVSEVTIADALRRAGYATASIGKWHLGYENASAETQGFEVNIGGSQIAEPPDFFYPAWKGKPAEPGRPYRGVPIEGRPGEYLTDRLTDEALRFIETHSNRPFFLYLSHYAVHVPVQAKQEMIEKYRGRTRAGDPQNNPVYAAMIESVDEGLGRIIRKLEALDIGRRTVIILTSDNGGLDAVDGPHTPATSNLPLRMGKLSLYEGGIRVPMIVKWPGAVRPGGVCHVPVISNDFFPTILEMAAVRQDPSNPVDGESLAPLLRRKGKPKRDALYWHYPHVGYNNARPSGAIRQGDFKLLEFFEDDRIELYHLARDIGEAEDLHAKMPQKAVAMRARLHAWQQSVGARKLAPNPDFKPAN